MDEWSSFAPVKKGKKGKKDPDPPPPPPEETIDLGASATTGGDAEEDWGGFSTGKKKKGKKGKVSSISDYLICIRFRTFVCNDRLLSIAIHSLRAQPYFSTTQAPVSFWTLSCSNIDCSESRAYPHTAAQTSAISRSLHA